MCGRRRPKAKERNTAEEKEEEEAWKSLRRCKRIGSRWRNMRRRGRRQGRTSLKALEALASLRPETLPYTQRWRQGGGRRLRERGGKRGRRWECQEWECWTGWSSRWKVR